MTDEVDGIDAGFTSGVAKAALLQRRGGGGDIRAVTNDGVSAIAEGEFPAVRIRGRVIVPAGAIDAMIEAATSEGTLVHSTDWANAPGH